MIPNKRIIALTLLLSAVFAFNPLSTCMGFHYPWDQNHDTVNVNMGNTPGTADSPLCDPCSDKSMGSPVYVANGHFVWMDIDISFAGRPTLGIGRSFNSNDPRDGSFGNGWTFNFEKSLYKVSRTTEDGSRNIFYLLRVPNGKRYQYDIKPDGTIISPPSRFDKIIPQQDGTDRLVNQDGSYEIYKNGKLTDIVDAFGNTLSLTYDANGVLFRAGDANNRFLEFSYGSNGRIRSIKDHADRAWAYHYDAQGNLISVTNPMGGIYRYEYEPYQPDGEGHTYFRITRITDETGVVIISVTYDNQRVATYTVGENVYTYRHDKKGKIVTKTDSMKSSRRFFYNSDGLIIKRVDPFRESTSTEYNPDGQIIKFTDEAGKIWQAAYDEAGRMLSRTNPLDQTLSFEYEGANPNPVKIISPTGRVMQIAYDERFNPVSLTDPSSAVRTIEWNSTGDIIAFIDPLKNRTEITYNAMGLPLTIQDIEGRTTRFGYDTRGNLIQVTAPGGNVTKREYDLLDRVIKITGAMNRSTAFTYDPAGRLTGLTGPDKRTTAYAYDEYGRLRLTTSADGRQTTFIYRKDNQVSRIDAPGDMTLSYLYNKAGWLTGETINGQTRSFRYTERGRLSRVSFSKRRIEFAYDDAGRMISESNNGEIVKSEYNAEGERIRMSAFGIDTDYTYDNMGRIIRIKNGEKQYAFSYDILGRRTRMTLPDGSSTDYTFNRTGLLTRIKHTGAFEADYGYSYDDNGRIVGWTGDGPAWKYQYDGFGRLTGFTHGSESVHHDFDVSGNRMDKHHVYDASNRLLEDQTFRYTYDTRGNLIQKIDKKSNDSTAFTWNFQNQLTHVKYFHANEAEPFREVAYTYGPMGRRTHRKEGKITEHFVYDGNEIVGVSGALSRDRKLFVHGPGIDEPLSITNPDGSSYYYHANIQGSVMALTDNAGNLVTQYSYSPYGKTSRTGKQVYNPFQYTGRENEGDDLYYYRARYYAPDLGRFLSEDPIGLSGGDFNLYRYVLNDPVNFSDPSGLHPIILDSPTKEKSSYKLIKLYHDSMGRLVIMGHGGAMTSKGTPLIKDDRRDRSIYLTAEQFAELIKENDDFDKSNGVLFISCHAGRGGDNSFANQVAEILGTVAYATEKTTTLNRIDKKMTITNYDSFKKFDHRNWWHKLF